MDNYSEGHIHGKGGPMICRVVQGRKSDAEAVANQERIVACINALVGIPDPAAFLKQISDFLDDYGCMCKEGAEMCPACVVRESMGNGKEERANRLAAKMAEENLRPLKQTQDYLNETFEQ